MKSESVCFHQQVVLWEFQLSPSRICQPVLLVNTSLVAGHASCCPSGSASLRLACCPWFLIGSNLYSFYVCVPMFVRYPFLWAWTMIIPSFVCVFFEGKSHEGKKKKQSRQQGKNSSNFISWKCDFVLYIDKFSCPVPTVESFLLYHMYSITFPIIQHMQNKIKIKITVQEQDEQEHQQNWKQQRILLHLVAVK